MKAYAFGLAALAAAASMGAAGTAGGQTATPNPSAASAAAPLRPEAVVQSVREVIARRYVAQELRPALDAVLAQGLSSGRYRVSDPALLAERINADIERVSQDRHVGFTFNPRQAAVLAAAQNTAAPDPTAMEREVRAANHGITELRVLPGNIRYVTFHGFMWIGPESAAAVDTAMRFLSGGDAIIIDLRENGGGSGDVGDYLANHFLPANQLLYTFYEEGSEVGARIATTDPAPPTGRLLGKPLYVLISPRTASAGEAFAGIVANHRLGEIVGETTAGAGRPNALVPIDGQFVLSVSTGRVVLAPSGREWEGVGIAPTIRTPVPAALEVAQAHALRRIAATAPAEDRPRLEATAEWLDARASPRSPARPLTAYVGDFGERRARVDEGRLRYQFGERPQRLLVPLGGDLFALDDDPATRIRFVVTGDRATALEVLPVGRPPQGRYERTS